MKIDLRKSYENSPFVHGPKNLSIFEYFRRDLYYTLANNIFVSIHNSKITKQLHIGFGFNSKLVTVVIDAMCVDWEKET